MHCVLRIILAALLTATASLVFTSVSVAGGPGSGTGSDQYVETIPDAKGPKKSPGEKGPKNDEVRAEAQIGAGGLEDFAAATAPAAARAENVRSPNRTGAARGKAGRRDGDRNRAAREQGRPGPTASSAIPAAAVAEQGGLGPLGLIGWLMFGLALIALAASRIRS